MSSLQAEGRLSFLMWDIITRALADMGLPGAIIAALLLTVGALCGVIRVMYVQANKVYGYRLAERDSYKDAMNNTAQVIAAMQEATKDRNDLTADLGELIKQQSGAFELLKVTILSEYDGIKTNNAHITQAVTSQAESLRQLTSLVTDHRNVGPIQIVDVKQAITAGTQAVITAINNALGQSTIISRKPRTPPR